MMTIEIFKMFQQEWKTRTTKLMESLGGRTWKNYNWEGVDTSFLPCRDSGKDLAVKHVNEGEGLEGFPEHLCT